jgi:hypothetical protein
MSNTKKKTLKSRTTWIGLLYQGRMLRNRDKAGKADVDWRDLALGKKFDRKSIGIGPYGLLRMKPCQFTKSIRSCLLL